MRHITRPQRSPLSMPGCGWAADRLTRCFLAISLLGTLTLPAAEPGVSPPRQVIVVFKTHFDIGYTDMASNVVAKYRTTMIDQALKVADLNRGLPPEQQFVWTLPGWPMQKILQDWPGQSPDRKERVLQAFKEGRFVVHALPFTTHTELLEPEDLVRGMQYSSALCRGIGQPLPRDAKMTDVPSHSWILPTLLRHAGVDFLHLGCNAASSSPRVPPLFWWEGPDGSRLLTMYTAESYGTGLVPPKNWPHRSWLALIHTGDNHGPPTPEEVRKVLDQAKRELPGVTVRIGRLSDFADAILAEKPKLPVVRGDMPDTWIHGPMADPRGARIARNVRPAMGAAESLATHLAAWGLQEPASAPNAGAWENSLLYGEHTWGGAFWWIYGKYTLKFGDAWEADRREGKFNRIESSWDEHTAYIDQAQASVATALERGLESLAGAVAAPGRRIVVFNPLPWKRDGLVALPGGSFQGALVDLATRKAVPHSVTENGQLRFVARDVPACGYKTFALSDRPAPPPPQATAAENTLENAFCKLTLDPARGVVTSWIDKRSGRELVDAGAPQGFGQYLYERFDRDRVQAFVKAYVKIDADWGINELGKPSLPPAAEVPYRAVSPGALTLAIHRDPVASTAVFRSSPGSSLSHGTTTRFVLYRDLPFLDVEITVQEKLFDAWPEAGWLCLPFRIEEPRFQLGRLASIVDPSTDFVPGCNFDQIALNGGLTVTDPKGRGIGLCALDSPLVSLGAPGAWNYSKEWTARKGRVFVNLFNNQWTTNFRLWNSGTWTSRVRVWPVRVKSAENALITPSDEARSPLLAAWAEGPGGKLPVTGTGLSLSRQGISVTAFGPNGDGPGTVLRVWEKEGSAGQVTVTLPEHMRPRQVQPIDLRGRPIGEAIPVKNGAFRFRIGAFAPASFLVAP